MVQEESNNEEETMETDTSISTDKETEIPTEVSAYVCPKCGKGYARFNSLRGHALGKHGISLRKEDFTVTEERATPRGEYKGESIPSMFENLLDVLKKVKCPKPEAVARVCEGLGFSQEALYQSLKQASAPVDVQRLALQLWALQLDEMVVPDLARRLGIQDRPYRGYEAPTTRETKREMQEEKAESFSLGREFGEMKSEIVHLKDGGKTDPVVLNEVKSLRKQLEDERQARINDKLDALSNKIEELKKQGGTDAEVVASTIRDVAKSYFNFLSGVTGEMEAPPQRKRVFQDKGSILNLVPEEMLE